MRFVKCPVCKTPIPKKSLSCQLCDTQFTRFQYFRMNHIGKTIATILLIALIYNVAVIIVQNRHIRSFMQTPPERIEQIEELEKEYETLNFFQKWFVRESEIEYIRKSFESRSIKGISNSDEITVYFDDGSKTGTYSGETIDGLPDGAGKFEYLNEYGEFCVYEGEFLEGKITGYGILTLPTGERRVGHYRAGNLHGYATIYGPLGNILYQGNFVNDKLNGEGVMYDEAKNIIYSGTFSHGFPHKDEYLRGCQEIVYSNLQYDLYSYVNKHIKITGVINDIVIDEQKSLVQYLIHSGDDENNVVRIEYEGEAMNLKIGNSITVYGYCVGEQVYTDSVARERTNVGIIGFYITKNQ